MILLEIVLVVAFVGTVGLWLYELNKLPQVRRVVRSLASGQGWPR